MLYYHAVNLSQFAMRTASNDMISFTMTYNNGMKMPESEHSARCFSHEQVQKFI